MAGLLTAFLRAEIAKPFVWGATDCAATADRWVELAAGRSPLSIYGRSYSGREEAEQWLAERGGIAIALCRVMRASGFARAQEPQSGDVGLIVHKAKLCVAIHAGRLWFSRDETGFIGAPLGCAWKAWRVAR